MKKAILIGGLGVFGVIALASCKKDYVCECDVDGQELNVAIQDAKKKDAQDACDAAETTYSSGGGSATCTLKED